MASGAAPGAERGVVHRARSAGVFDMGHLAPPPAAEAFVEHLWWVRWDRTGLPPHTTQTIPSPVAHLALEGGPPEEVRHGHRLPALLVHGVHTHPFRVALAGAGWVAGVHFRPGGWAAWTGRDAAAMTDRVVEADGPEAAVAAELLAIPDLEGRARQLGDEVAATAPEPSADYLVICAVEERVRADPAITRVEQLGELSGWSTRTLQRRFRSIVGVGPKWVLRRHRLLDAALRLEQDPDVDLADLAVTLGWYDQAHLTNDFRRMLGASPADYAARSRPGP